MESGNEKPGTQPKGTLLRDLDIIIEWNETTKM